MKTLNEKILMLLSEWHSMGCQNDCVSSQCKKGNTITLFMTTTGEAGVNIWRSAGKHLQQELPKME